MLIAISPPILALFPPRLLFSRDAAVFISSVWPTSSSRNRRKLWRAPPRHHRWRKRESRQVFPCDRFLQDASSDLWSETKDLWKVRDKADFEKFEKARSSLFRDWTSSSFPFLRLSTAPTILPPASSKPAHLRERLNIIRSIVLRNPNFLPPLAVGQGKERTNYMKVRSSKTSLYASKSGKHLHCPFLLLAHS